MKVTSRTRVGPLLALANLPLFKKQSAEEIDRLAKGTREFHVPRGQILFRRGDRCEGFHVIVYGQIKLAFNAADGAEKVVEIMGPGQSFGEAVMFMEKPYPVYSQALAGTTRSPESRTRGKAQIGCRLSPA